MFYLKRAQKTEKIVVDDYAYPIVGKIIIGRSIAQFSTKLKVAENLWHVKSGRAIGKSKVATELKFIKVGNLSLSYIAAKPQRAIK